MKKVFLAAIMLVGLSISAQAQEKNALGLRLGDNDGFGGEVSYQRYISSDNRLEFDLGWRDSKNYDAIKLAALYQWVWNIDGGFNWYAGVGGGLGSWEFDDGRIPDGFDDDNDSGTFFFAAGNLGIEYNFDIPIQLSLDIRPELYFGDDFREDDFGPDIALGIRYRF
ncbi:porin family protein [Flavobacterium litorale]|uniref:Porin family protein n=1 Tax=Flavobacterium litorale TaxID=2856519 RepID=A0ABX8V4W3_9FLAO|nr:porin family protein [Flavobacterium litorale]QYJ67874.1 porin family protein [Flavobacterium litorale]